MRLPFNGNYAETQGFGVNKASYIKFGLEGHNGKDYALPTGTEVVAPHDGKVIEVANDPSGYGKYVKIESNLEGSVLAHLQSTNVSVGQDVKEGQVIGYSDNTGNSTGPHLHWGYYRLPRNRQNGFAGFIDQTSYIGKASNAVPLDDKEFLARLNAKSTLDKFLIHLLQAKRINDADSKIYLLDPNDPDKALGLLKAIWSEREDYRKRAESQPDVAKAKEEGRKLGIKQVQDAALKVV